MSPRGGETRFGPRTLSWGERTFVMGIMKRA